MIDGGHTVSRTTFISRFSTTPWLRRLGTTELINALPDTDTDLVIRAGGDKSSQYSVQRQHLASAPTNRHIVVVGAPPAG